MYFVYFFVLFAFISTATAENWYPLGDKIFRYSNVDNPDEHCEIRVLDQKDFVINGEKETFYLIIECLPIPATSDNTLNAEKLALYADSGNWFWMQNDAIGQKELLNVNFAGELVDQDKNFETNYFFRWPKASQGLYRLNATFYENAWMAYRYPADKTIVSANGQTYSDLAEYLFSDGYGFWLHYFLAPEVGVVRYSFWGQEEPIQTYLLMSIDKNQ